MRRLALLWLAGCLGGFPAAAQEVVPPGDTPAVGAPAEQRAGIVNSDYIEQPEDFPNGVEEIIVKVRVRLDAEGRVVSAEAVEMGFPAFDRAAVNSVCRWTFRPRIKDGVAVPSGLIVPLAFRAPPGPD